MRHMKKIAPDDFVQIFKLAPEDPAPRAESKPITFWLGDEHKAKFDLLQSKSKKKFGKFLKQVLEKTIDGVEPEKAA